MKETVLHGLFPLVRAEVLRLLFTNVGQELYTREVARLSFLALRTVQDELAKLEAAKLIVSRSNGYHRFYRANPKHPLYRSLAQIVRKSVRHSRARPRPLPSRRAEPVKSRRAGSVKPRRAKSVRARRAKSVRARRAEPVKARRA